MASIQGVYLALFGRPADPADLWPDQNLLVVAAR